MSIKAYFGRMGSGKTYEVVSEVILGALRRGRRVISNIAGLDYDEFCTLLIEEGIPADRIGKLVLVSHDVVQYPDFWLTDKDDFSLRVDGLIDKKTGEHFHCIQPGDLVALDENWRFWEGYSTKAMPERVMNFFRMHRHFTHSITGVACDVALISQDVMDFSRKVRAVIEETYYMEKLTAVGSTKRYRVDVHQGGKMTRRPLLQLQRSYNPKYFPLYKSNSMAQEGGADAKEENIDGRGNILNGAIFKVGLPLAGLLLIISGYGMYKFFNPSTDAENVSNPSTAISAPNVPASQNSPPASKPEINIEWRVTGYYFRDDGLTVLLQGSGGVVRVLNSPPNFKMSSLGVEVELPEGGFATPWTIISKSDGIL